VKAGDVTAFDDFDRAGRALLDIERQMYGSQSSYFATLDTVKAIAINAYTSQQAIADAAANRDSPFAATAANGSASVVGAIGSLDDSIGGRLDALNSNVIYLAELTARQASATASPTYAPTASYF